MVVSSTGVSSTVNASSVGSEREDGAGGSEVLAEVEADAGAVVLFLCLLAGVFFGVCFG